VPLSQAKASSVPKYVYQLDVLLFGLIKASISKKKEKQKIYAIFYNRKPDLWPKQIKGKNNWEPTP
jgi:hypothetical protein